MSAATSTGKGTPRDTLDTVGQRYNLYGLLTMTFAQEPTRQVLQKLREPELSQVLSELGVELDEDFSAAPEEEILEKLAVEFARLFLGPGKHLSPHESVYVGPYGSDNGEHGLLWGPATVQVKHLYHEFGFSLPEDFSGMPDHLAIELQLMQRLVEKELSARRAGDRTDVTKYVAQQIRMLEEHLLRWVPAYCQQVMEKAHLGIYRGMAKVTKDFILADYRELKDLGNKDLQQ